MKAYGPDITMKLIGAEGIGGCERDDNMVEQAKNIADSAKEVSASARDLAETSNTLTGYVQKFKI